MLQDIYHQIFLYLALFQFISPVFSFQDLRFLESKNTFPSSTPIEIAIKYDGADYFQSAFSEPAIFYCEKTMAPLGVNEICALKTSQMSFTKSLVISDTSQNIVPTGDRILFFKQNFLYIYGLLTDFDRPRTQMITPVPLTLHEGFTNEDDIHFDPANQQVIVSNGPRVAFYKLNGLMVELKTQVQFPLLESIAPENRKLFYFKDKYVVLFDVKSSQMSLFSIDTDMSLRLKTKYDNSHEVFVDGKFVYVFTNGKLKALDGEEEITSDFPYSIKALARTPLAGLFVYVENSLDVKESAKVFRIEVTTTKEFKITRLFTCPKKAKAMYLTSRSVFLAYENWVRVYSTVREKEFSEALYYDFVITDHVLGVMVSQKQEFLVVKGQDEEVQLFQSEKTPFGLECKKEKGSAAIEYNFQVRCLIAKCDNPEATTQKFPNGTCAYSSQIRVYFEDEEGIAGVALLIGLSFAAGIAITMGIGVFSRFGKRGDPSSPSRSPKSRRAFNLNRGLRQHSIGSDTSQLEDLREAMSTSMTINKKKPVPTFETPRFTSFGAPIAHVSHGNAPTSAFVHAATNPPEKHMECVELLKDGNGTPTNQSGEGAEGLKLKIDKVKLAEIKAGGKDLVSFRKDLASFRDTASPNNTIPEVNEPKDEPEEKHKGMYKEFHDEKEDKPSNDGDEERHLTGGHDDEGSFSKS